MGFFFFCFEFKKQKLAKLFALRFTMFIRYLPSSRALPRRPSPFFCRGAIAAYPRPCVCKSMQSRRT